MSPLYQPLLAFPGDKLVIKQKAPRPPQLQLELRDGRSEPIYQTQTRNLLACFGELSVGLSHSSLEKGL